MSTEQKIIKNKIGLLRLAEELGNVSRACKVMGHSRDAFYEVRRAFQVGGVAGWPRRSEARRALIRTAWTPRSKRRSWRTR